MNPPSWNGTARPRGAEQGELAEPNSAVGEGGQVLTCFSDVLRFRLSGTLGWVTTAEYDPAHHRSFYWYAGNVNHKDGQRHKCDIVKPCFFRTAELQESGSFATIEIEAGCL